MSIVVVTGANGLVGARVCAALLGRGAEVRAVVRRAGTAPEGPSEHVGDFADPEFAAQVLAGADAAVTTVHPMASDLETQRRVGVEGTTGFARVAAEAGVAMLVHVSTAAVYDRGPDVGEVDESAALVGDDAGPYPVTKRDLDAALGTIDGLTRVLLRPPAILGPGETSVWNSLRPAAMRDHEHARRAIPDQTFPWVHVEDLADLAGGVATGAIDGPQEGTCTPVNVCGEPATMRAYFETVCGAVSVEPVWEDGPAWTGRYRADRARGWGWRPNVSLAHALAELADGLRS